MTWFDHTTDSLWSQPTGTALRGEFEGVRLELVPSMVTPWEVWVAEHPDTLILKGWRPHGFNPFHDRIGLQVAGIELGDHAKAYLHEAVAAEIVVNDTLGDIPLVLISNPETGSLRAFLRSAAGQPLSFTWEDGKFVDKETGSAWDPIKGLALEGPLQGELLKEIPYATFFDWAWLDFFPGTDIYGLKEGDTPGLPEPP
ncbi:MAG: Protein of unknown function (DUF3179)/Protein of unknown function (DUF3179) [Chloroflexi bacterium]|jgi:hypothetical protein|nr:MAG: Protein of unknown function (DUF3179)/Protein of unknown function (DUF3179) [Chloroflexota bacterium]